MYEYPSWISLAVIVHGKKYLGNTKSTKSVDNRLYMYCVLYNLLFRFF